MPGFLICFRSSFGGQKPQKYCVTGVLNCLVITNYMSGHIKHRRKFPCLSRRLCANIVSDIHGASNSRYQFAQIDWVSDNEEQSNVLTNEVAVCPNTHPHGMTVYGPHVFSQTHGVKHQNCICWSFWHHFQVSGGKLFFWNHQDWSGAPPSNPNIFSGGCSGSGWLKGSGISSGFFVKFENFPPEPKCTIDSFTILRTDMKILRAGK